MTSLSELTFFITPAHKCSYIDDRQATTLFVDPDADVDNDLYSALSAIGFRRSGQHIYRPHCQDCRACVPVRVLAQSFTARRRHHRVMARNKDLTIHQTAPSNNDEYFELYRRYIHQRHADGDMYPAEPDQFTSFLVDGRPEATFYEFREQGILLAVAVADKMNDGLSAIYTFFEPDKSERSLGVFAILHLLEETKRQALDYLYLGYWIKQSQKMNYKMEYKPIEVFRDNHWIEVQK